MRLGVVQADRAQEAVHTVYERGTSKIGLGGDDGPAPATQADVAALRKEIAALRDRAQGVQARAGAGVDGPQARDPADRGGEAGRQAGDGADDRRAATAAKPAAAEPPAHQPARPRPAVARRGAAGAGLDRRERRDLDRPPSGGGGAS